MNRRVDEADLDGAFIELQPLLLFIEEGCLQVDLAQARIFLMKDRFEEAVEASQRLLKRLDPSDGEFLTASSILHTALVSQNKNIEAEGVIKSTAAAIFKTVKIKVLAGDRQCANDLLMGASLVIPEIKPLLEKNAVFRYACDEPGAG